MIGLVLPHGIAPSQLGHYALDLVLLLFGLTLAGICVAIPLHRRQTRREVTAPGLWAVVGRMGAGKTFFMAWCAVRALSEGRVVFSNFRLRGSVPFSEWSESGGRVVLVRSWSEVLAAPDGALVLLDEMHLWWPSDAKRVPVSLAAWLSQLRKRRLTVVWSSQDWAFVGRRVRRLTFGVWEGQPLGGRSVYSQYPPQGYDQSFRSRPKRSARMVLRHSRAVREIYDTREIVLGLSGFGDEGGELSGGVGDDAAALVPLGPAGSV